MDQIKDKQLIEFGTALSELESHAHYDKFREMEDFILKTMQEEALKDTVIKNVNDLVNQSQFHIKAAIAFGRIQGAKHLIESRNIYKNESIILKQSTKNKSDTTN